MLTEFGKALRKLRIDNDERILDMAKKIGKSSAFVSSIEHGQKPLPDAFDDLIIETYGLDGLQAQTIRQAYTHSKKFYATTTKRHKSDFILLNDVIGDD